MNVKLIFVPALIREGEFEKLYSPPMAIYLLATIARQQGINASIIDPCEFLQFEYEENYLDECTKYIIKDINSMNALAFSVNSFNWGITKILIERIRVIDKDIPIIIGGLHATKFDEHILKSVPVNYILRGEGEESFPQLLKTIYSKGSVEKVKGVSYINDGNVVRTPNVDLLDSDSLSCFPSPDYSLIPEENHYSQIPVESSRGCPFCCCFCSIPNRRHWAYYKTKDVIKRVDDAIKTANTMNYKDYLLFVDDCFTINGDRAKDILNSLYSKYRGKKKFFIEARISNILESNIFQSINNDVLSGIQIGVECGYNEGLKKVNKKLTIEQLYEGMEILKTQGIAEKCMLSFIIGFPWETKHEIDKTLSTMEDISKRYGAFCNLNWLIYLPSKLWEERYESKILVDEGIFDDPLWLIDRELFFRVHPNIDLEIVKYVESVCLSLKNNKVNIEYNAPFSLNDI